MTDTTVDTIPAAHGFPADQYLRSITFLDAAYDDGEQVPVHVTSGILFNGQPAAIRTSREHEWHISGSCQRELIASFVVHPDDVTIGHRDDNGHTWPTIGGLRVFTPADPKFLWQTLHTYRAVEAVAHRKDEPRMLSAYPERLTDTWVRVFVQVREVLVTAEQPNESVQS